MYWRSLGDGRIKCDLCPVRCVLWPGRRGACKVRVNLDGKLYSLVHSRIAGLGVDPIEKKPLFHVVPGSGAYSIATVGCNLGCIFCQNWEISQADPVEFHSDPRRRLVQSPEEVVASAKRSGCTSIAFTYTEPTIFYEYMLETAKLAKAEGLKTLWITCGYINPEPLRELVPYLDAANVDLKGFSEKFYQTYCGGTLAPVLETLKTLRKMGVWVEVTNLVVPGANDSDEMLQKLCEWVRDNLGDETPVHFSRYHPDYKLRRPATPAKTLKRAKGIAKETGLKHIYIGNYWVPDGETTFCPKCEREIIVRVGYSIRANNIRDGKCPSCETEISGRWK
ncbi:MAG: AmmeMemoRadiSam system radical SAM enzyme [Planctomycetota bacterium]|nr:MAG: AmmeMemoRadiSam system radical SAM enzyme [Planctomycetota bacterium]